MRLRLTLALALLSLVTLSATSHASHAVVPDDFLSIQAAMDSGTDSVLVKDGTYYENLVMNRSVNLVAYRQDHNPHVAAPVVGRFTINPAAGRVEGVVNGLRMRGPASLSLDLGSVTFEACRFDSGAVANSGGGSNYLYLSGCTILRQCVISVAAWEVVDCTLIGTGLDGHYEGYALVKNNVVLGPATFGISLPGQDGGVQISGNLVIGTVDGISSPNPAGTRVTDNEVRNCSGTAFLCVGPPFVGSITYARNRAIACGGRGFYITNPASATVDSNVVDSVGSDGIAFASGVAYLTRGNTITSAGGSGIAGAAGTFALEIRGNRIVRTGGPGIGFAGLGPVRSNVVGRTHGGGIVVTSGSPPSLIRGNTVFECSGAGISTPAHVDSIDHNISFGNSGAGLAWSAPGVPILGCNDWFGNSAGSTFGVASGGTDLSVNPLFCDLPNGNVALSSASPLAAASGCGLIGALGIGCGSSVSVWDGGLAGGLSLAIAPTPSRGRVSFALNGLDTGGVIEVFDLSGARRWTANIAPRQRGLQWSGLGRDGSPVPVGVYYARLASNGGQRCARIVLVR